MTVATAATAAAVIYAARGRDKLFAFPGPLGHVTSRGALNFHGVWITARECRHKPTD